MIICSCNVLKDSELARFCSSDIASVEQLYACLGCEVKCGRCADYVESVMLAPQRESTSSSNCI